MQTFEGGKVLDNGFVFRDGANHAIERARIRPEWAEHEHELRRAQIEIVEASGQTHRLSAQPLGSFPILRNDVWLEETHVAYTREGASGSREGQGVIEHVWRATPDEISARAARFAPLLAALRK
jgi:hypothetical protein